jgi:hypothetical protein
MILAVVLLAQLTLSGQTSPAKADPPLHCEKYQHVVKGHPAYSSGACDFGTAGSTNCIDMYIWHEAVPDSCAEDMHEVTERDWQDVTRRLRELEAWLYCFQHDCPLMGTP